MDDRVARARSSSSASSLFFPTPKAPPQRGNFLMTYFSCPVGSLEQNSVHSSARPRGATLITENTYKMEPDKRFSVAEVRAILHQHLQSLETQKYDAKLCREVAKGMCNSIMSDLKLLGYSRFKFVCSVTIGQNKGQGVRIASRSVWDTNCDQFVSESFKNETLFAVGVVFGVYKEWEAKLVKILPYITLYILVLLFEKFAKDSLAWENPWPGNIRKQPPYKISSELQFTVAYFNFPSIQDSVIIHNRKINPYVAW